MVINMAENINNDTIAIIDDENVNEDDDLKIGQDDDNNKNEIKQDLTFLYRVKQRVCTKSFGVECAKSAGVSKEIRDRTQLIMNALHKKESIPPMIDINHQKLIDTANQILSIIMINKPFTDLIEKIKHW